MPMPTPFAAAGPSTISHLLIWYFVDLTKISCNEFIEGDELSQQKFH